MWMPAFDALGNPTFVDPMTMAWPAMPQPETVVKVGEKKTDRDVRRLGSFFGIDHLTLERLDELLEKRGASRERDLAKLYEVLEAARSPERLLMAKMEEMEDGQFVTNFKRDEAIDGLCHRFGLSEAARCRLVELRVRRGGAAEDYRRLTEHLELSADASWTAVSLIKKVTQGRLSELPDLSVAKKLLAQLDQAAKRKLREVVEKRAEGDLEAVLAQVEEVLSVAFHPSSSFLKVADTYLTGGLLSPQQIEVMRLEAKQQARRQKLQQKAMKKKKEQSSSSSSSSSSGKKKKKKVKKKVKKKSKKEKKG